MKYVKVGRKKWFSKDTAMLVDGKYTNAEPMLYETNWWEGAIHFLGYHFSFGQPYCVVCGYAELIEK